MGRARIAQEIYRDTLVELISPETEWLDLGCGRELIRTWLKDGASTQKRFKAVCKRIVGIDAVENDVRLNPYIHEGVVGDFLRMPFPDSSFSLVTANMVVEHVTDPVGFAGEVRRVLRPGGSFVFLTPNLGHWVVAAARMTPDLLKRPIVHWLDGRDDSDIFPTYYRLNTAKKIRLLLRQSGFQIIDVKLVETPALLPKVPILRNIDRRMNLLVIAK